MVRLVYFGTYDTGKPRNRIMIRALREVGVEVVECHVNVWSEVADKSQISRLRWVRQVTRWLAAYPALARRYRSLPAHDAVMIGYMGHLDVIVFKALLGWRGVPVIWDVFLSLYDTVVSDRQMISRCNPLAWLLKLWERVACRAADHLVMDTKAHGRLLTETYGVPAEKVSRVWVGAESELFSTRHRPSAEGDGRISVLFYGQFIPLHGIATIIEAAALDKAGRVDWHIIGKGQEEKRISAMLHERPNDHIRWDSWVAYETLADAIVKADVCLGIFGGSGKAGRVIPNKVYQILSVGRALVTRILRFASEFMSG